MNDTQRLAAACRKWGVPVNGPDALAVGDYLAGKRTSAEWDNLSALQQAVVNDALRVTNPTALR